MRTTSVRARRVMYCGGHETRLAQAFRLLPAHTLKEKPVMPFHCIVARWITLRDGAAHQLFSRPLDYTVRQRMRRLRSIAKFAKAFPRSLASSLVRYSRRMERYSMRTRSTDSWTFRK